jgi:dTDP-glucose 4,6-dehydratase
MRLVVTGGAGFIGSHFVRSALGRRWADEVVVVDALTYAGNLENLAAVERHPGLRFAHCDVADPAALRTAVGRGADAFVHFAAESHVDRSIDNAAAFVRTNVAGTQVVLDLARQLGVKRVLHVSTDEVYGSLELGTRERFTETTPLSPTSPYAASKAAADLLALAAHRTHGLDVVVTRCSNNYGPYQFPEKLIPLFITNGLGGERLPLYGDGQNVRDWIHVDDHVGGLHLALTRGKPGEVYNLGGECERPNAVIARAIVDALGVSHDLITPVKDRPAHDRRYAIDCTKAKRELGFAPGAPLESRLPEVVDWYRAQRGWWERVRAGEYRSYYQRHYTALGLRAP